MLNADVILDRYLNECDQAESQEEYIQSIMDELESSYPGIEDWALHSMAEKVASDRAMDAYGDQCETDKFNERYY